MKHGFPSILSSSKKKEERDEDLGRLRRPGLVASADELRGRRKLCQLQCPCVEFVLDSHALELRVLGLTSVWKTVLAEPFWKVRETCPFQRRRLWAWCGSNGQTTRTPCGSSGDHQAQHGIVALRAQTRFQIQKIAQGEERSPEGRGPTRSPAREKATCGAEGGRGNECDLAPFEARKGES